MLRLICTGRTYDRTSEDSKPTSSEITYNLHEGNNRQRSRRYILALEDMDRTSDIAAITLESLPLEVGSSELPRQPSTLPCQIRSEFLRVTIFVMNCRNSQKKNLYIRFHQEGMCNSLVSTGRGRSGRAGISLESIPSNWESSSLPSRIAVSIADLL